MAERIAQGAEGAGLITVITIWVSASMNWLNDNHLAVISIVTIITGLVTVISAVYRYKLKKRELDIYYTDVLNKGRRKGDKK